MSANPQPRPLVTGDLDLLISRSLDGDLPGEEERELKSLLATDPAARARYDAMARLVGRLEELPEPDLPFALATRVSAQVETDSTGFTATLHRFGFYFRPATLGVIVAGLFTVSLVYTLRTPPKPTATVAEAKAQPAAAPVDDGRVNVYFTESEKEQGEDKKDAARPAQAAPASAPVGALAAAPPAEARNNEAKGARRQEPVLVASAEDARPKREESFAPERDAPTLAAAAPAPAAADESVAEGFAMQKSAASEAKRSRPAAPAAAGAARAAGTALVVGKAEGVLRFATPPRLEGLVGPFEGTYRLELDGSGRVTEVARLFGGSGTEPASLPGRLRDLSFGPADAARAAGSVDVRVLLP